MARVIRFPIRYPTEPCRIIDGVDKPDFPSTWSPPPVYSSAGSKMPGPSDDIPDAGPQHK